MENRTPSTRQIKHAKQRRSRPQRSVSKNLGDAFGCQGIRIPDGQEVLSYLQRHSELGKILPSVCAQARQEFGKEGELILSVYRDPEIEDRHLTLTVRLPAYDKNVTQRLDRVTQPYEAELCDASGYLLVTTDFRISQAKNGI